MTIKIASSAKDIKQITNQYLTQNPQLKKAIKVFNITKVQYRQSIASKTQLEGSITTNSTGK